MIRISDEQLRQGVALAQEVSTCFQVINYLWGDPKSLPQDDCEIIDFRKTFESNSPALFGEFIKFSGYEKIIQNYNGLQIERGNREQTEKAQIELDGLMFFIQAYLFVAYPLFLANNREVPFLLPGEIEKIKDDFSREPLGLMEKELDCINHEWSALVNTIMNDVNRPQEYIKAIRLLLRLFLEGIKKTQPPCLFEMTEVEKQEFFKEIENFLIRNRA